MLNDFPKCKEHILFIHAFTGCDTTSAFFARSKTKFAKICESRTDVQNAAEVFKRVDVNLDDLFQAGIKCVLALYGAKKEEADLNVFRYNTFIKSVGQNSTVKLASLPPTANAAMDHIKRVYLQMQSWMDNKLPPENWGWKKNNENLLMPVTMTQRPAPDNLLEMIFCGCKTGCGAAWGCRKAGLFCTIACAVCSGQDCTNCTPCETNHSNEQEETI